LVYKVGADFFEVMRMNSWQRRDIFKALIAAPVAVTGSSYVVEAADTFIQQLHAHDQSEDIPIHGNGV
jgi:hypothetical protein